VLLDCWPCLYSNLHLECELRWLMWGRNSGWVTHCDPWDHPRRNILYAGVVFVHSNQQPEYELHCSMHSSRINSEVWRNFGWRHYPPGTRSDFCMCPTISCLYSGPRGPGISWEDTMGRGCTLTSYLASFLSYGWLLVKFSLATGKCLTLTPSLGWSPANIAIDDTSLK